MRKNILIISLLALLTSQCLTITKKDDYEVLMISALWRHGARVSRKNVFKLEDSKYDPQDLTGNGARMHYILGQQISQYDYPELFTTTEPRRYMIYSTQTQRTQISAYSLAMGLFAPKLNKGPKVTPSTSTVGDKLKI